MNKSSLVRVQIVDDDEPRLRRVTDMLASEPSLQIVGTASDRLEAMAQALTLHPDVILMDIGLPGLDGIWAAREILECYPDIKIIFLSQDVDLTVVQAALDVGHGYVMKSDGGKELIAAIKVVMLWKKLVSSTLGLMPSKIQ